MPFCAEFLFENTTIFNCNVSIFDVVLFGRSEGRKYARGDRHATRLSSPIPGDLLAI